MSTDRDGRREAREATGPPRPTGAEWVVFSVSAVAIVAVVAVLLFDWATRSSSPPTFRLTPGAVRAAEGAFHVPVDVENIGSRAAADVYINAELKMRGEMVTAEETIKFLAPGETTGVTFVFELDPRQGELSVSVTAFRDP